MSVLTHSTDVRLPDWYREGIRETDQRIECGNAGQTLEPGLDAIDRSIKEDIINEVHISLLSMRYTEYATPDPSRFL